MEISITWNICRVCLQEEQKNAKNSNEVPMRQIFSEDNKLPKQIFGCSGITMRPNDSLPDKICQKCISVLKYAVYFRKTCRSSDTYLQSVLERTKLASNLFKPERPIDFENEYDDRLNFGEADNEQKEPLEEHAEEELEDKEILKSKQGGIQNSKKVKLKDSLSSIVMEYKEKNTEMEENTNIEDIAQGNEGKVDDDDSCKVEMEEEIIEHPEEIMEQMFSNTTEVNSQPNSANTEDDDIEAEEDNSERLRLQVFYENANYTKLSEENQPNKLVENSEDEVDEDYDLIETQETDMQNLKQHNDQMYYIFKDIKNKNRHVGNSILNDEEDNHLNEDDHVDAAKEDDNEDENIATEDNVDFMPIDGEEHEIMLQLEQDMDDNQSLVTSTVITNDDERNANIYNEQNSNSSNETQDLSTEYIIDEYLIDDSNSNNSSQNFHTTRTKKQHNNSTKFSTTSNKTRNSDILAGRRCKKKFDPTAIGSKQIFLCNICGNHFKSRQILNGHLKVHRQEKNHECEICFKRFITACNLQAHMRTHTGEKPFECQYCGRRFSDRSSNLRHERTHTNEKPFHCVHCGKSFALATTLQAHLKVHTGERSYRCESCDKSFKLSHQLKAHQNTTLHKAVEQLVKLEN